jgi:hypothetical protein
MKPIQLPFTMLIFWGLFFCGACHKNHIDVPPPVSPVNPYDSITGDYHGLMFRSNHPFYSTTDTLTKMETLVVEQIKGDTIQISGHDINDDTPYQMLCVRKHDWYFEGVYDQPAISVITAAFEPNQKSLNLYMWYYRTHVYSVTYTYQGKK